MMTGKQSRFPDRAWKQSRFQTYPSQKFECSATWRWIDSSQTNRKQNAVVQKKIYIMALPAKTRSLILLNFIFTRFLNQAFWTSEKLCGDL